MASSTTDHLTPLLSKLPSELRLSIYELCLPLMWHRRSRIRLDYLSDCAWTATSPEIFHEAAPLVLSKSVLCVRTKLKDPRTLFKEFSNVVKVSFPDDHEWVLPLAKGMVRKLAISIKYMDFRLLGIVPLLEAYLADLSSFTALEELQISVGPECLPSMLQHWNWQSERDRYFNYLAHESGDHHGVLHGIVNAVRELHVQGCAVEWAFDTSSMPDWPNGVRDRSTIVKHLKQLNQAMQELWRKAVEEEVPETCPPHLHKMLMNQNE